MVTEEQKLCMGCMSRLDENGKCRCGFDESEPTDPRSLPLRTVIGRKYLVGKMISSDNEGMDYISFNLTTNERCVLREFMPANIAHRNEYTGDVESVNGEDAQYKCLRTDFYDLFDALRNIQRAENMIPVIDVITDKNTVYAVFKYIRTISYGDYLSRNGGEFTWPQVKKLFMPLFTTITYLHGNGIVHRGISPESIRVNSKGELLLSGFGTANLYTKDSVIDPVLSDGYAAPEQYSTATWMGDWTDVYSVAAVLYKSLTGTLPEDANLRMDGDRLLAPSELEENIPSNVSDAIMNAMVISAETRTQSIDSFTAELLESKSSNTMLYDPQKNGSDINLLDKSWDISASEGEKMKKIRDDLVEHEKKKPRWGLLVFIIALVALIAVVLFVFRYSKEFLGFGGDDNTSKGQYLSLNTPEEPETPQEDYLVTVPNFVGRFRDDVEGNNQYKQFVLEFTEENNPSYSEGMIFEQSVKYRTEVEEGTAIELKVSKGPEKVPMPNVIGFTVEEATAMLDELGIVYQLMPNFANGYEYKIVYDQSVPEGDEVATGNTLTKVNIFYGASENSVSYSYSDDDDGGGKIVLGG